MAFGDSDRSQNQINYQGGLAQNHLNNSRDAIVNQNQTLWNNYLSGSEKDKAALDEIMNSYRGFLSGPGLTSSDAYKGYSNLGSGGGSFSVDPALRGRTAESLAGYSDFAKTGGYSPQDIQDLRARAIAPTRAVYANAQSNLDRQRSLQGGYSPNFTAATAKMARDLSAGISDANVNANASIAQAIQQGKLAGLGGLTNTSLGQQSADTSLNNLNAQQRLAGLGGMSDLTKQQSTNQLSGIKGMSDLYGTSPGLTSTTGNQALNSSNQLLQTNQLQNQLAQIIMNAQNQKAGIPGNFQQALGSISSILGLGGQIGSGIAGFGGGPTSLLGSTQTVPNTGFMPTGLSGM